MVIRLTSGMKCASSAYVDTRLIKEPVRSGFSKHMQYDQFLFAANYAKLDMYCLDGVSRLGGNNGSIHMHTEAN